MEKSPKYVRELFENYQKKLIFVPIEKEMITLANEYIIAKGLTNKSFDDAIHIATASLHRLDVIVSWNFKHIVNLNRIKVFHSVNRRFGLPEIEIRSPKEVLIVKP